MKIFLKRIFLASADKYEVYSEASEKMYTIKAQTALGGFVAIGGCMDIIDNSNNVVGTIRREIGSISPKFEFYNGSEYVGCIRKKLNIFRLKLNMDFNGWYIEGNYIGWNYKIFDNYGNKIGSIVRRELNVLIIEVNDPKDCIYALISAIVIGKIKKS